jgi:integrase/ribosomal protein L37E
MEDIYNTKRVLNYWLNRIDKSKISQTNKKLIKGFIDECYSNGLNDKRIIFYLTRLWKILQMTNKNLDQLTKSDIKRMVGEIEKSDYTEWTKHSYKVSIKKVLQFVKLHDRKDYKWKNYKRYPEEVDWIELTMKNNNEKQYKILTPDDIKNLINNANEPRTKALISVLFDSGVRVGELLNMNYGDVIFDSDGDCRINVSGKTGYRSILLVPSIIHLKSWLDQHPTKKTDDPLWCSLARNSMGKRLSYGHTRSILLKIKKKSGIDKPVNPHNFRHSESSYSCQFLSDAQMSVKHGWSFGSKMPRVYEHIKPKDTENAIKRMYGKTTKEENNTIIDITKCVRCGHENSFELEFCEVCSFPLTPKAVMKLKERKESEEKELIRRIIESGSLNNLIDHRVKELLKKNGTLIE